MTKTETINLGVFVGIATLLVAWAYFLLVIMIGGTLNALHLEKTLVNTFFGWLVLCLMCVVILATAETASKLSGKKVLSA